MDTYIKIALHVYLDIVQTRLNQFCLRHWIGSVPESIVDRKIDIHYVIW